MRRRGGEYDRQTDRERETGRKKKHGVIKSLYSS
jgi:hypothetical protein